MRIEKYKYIDKEIATALIEKAKIMSTHNKSGGNSKAFIIDDYVVLKTGNIELKNLKLFNETIIPFDVVVDKLQELYKKGVNVVPILGYFYNDETISNYTQTAYGKGAIIQKRAKGIELWSDTKLPFGDVVADKNVKDNIIKWFYMLSNTPQTQYDKFVSDFRAITDWGIVVDPSKKSNFFYDSKIGFQFIDLNFIGEPIFDKKINDISHGEFISYCLLPCYSFLTTEILQKHFDNNKIDYIKKSNLEIYNKCKKALIKQGIKADDIDLIAKKQLIIQDENIIEKD